jgi:hypothetical protein
MPDSSPLSIYLFHNSFKLAYDNFFNLRLILAETVQLLLQHSGSIKTPIVFFICIQHQLSASKRRPIHLERDKAVVTSHGLVITHGVFFGPRVRRHVLSWMAGRVDQAVMVARRVAKGVALVVRAAVAVTVRTSASPFTAHIAR